MSHLRGLPRHDYDSSDRSSLLYNAHQLLKGRLNPQILTNFQKAPNSPLPQAFLRAAFIRFYGIIWEFPPNGAYEPVRQFAMLRPVSSAYLSSAHCTLAQCPVHSAQWYLPSARPSLRWKQTLPNQSSVRSLKLRNNAEWFV